MASRYWAAIYKLLLLNYRRTQRLFWEVRAADLQRLYGADKSDYPTVRGIIQRYHPDGILDLGCGYGRLFPLYAELGAGRVLGVDISVRALDLARRAFPKVPTARASAEDFAPDQPFDLVVINRVFQHLPPENLARAIANTARIARRLIYLNEISDSENANIAGARYMFKHDYAALFAQQGWKVLEQALIPATHQTYLLLGRADGDYSAG